MNKAFTCLAFLPFLACSCSGEPIDPFPYQDFEPRALIAPFDRIGKDIDEQFLIPENISWREDYYWFPTGREPTGNPYQTPELRQTEIVAVCPLNGGFVVYHDLRGTMGSGYWVDVSSWDNYKTHIPENTSNYYYPIYWKEGNVYPTLKQAILSGLLSADDAQALSADSFTRRHQMICESGYADAKEKWYKSDQSYRDAFLQRTKNYHAPQNERVEQAKETFYTVNFLSKGIDDDRAWSFPALYQARKVEKRSITCFRYLELDDQSMLLSFDVNGFARDCGSPVFLKQQSPAFIGGRSFFDEPLLAPYYYCDGQLTLAQDAVTSGLLDSTALDLFSAKAQTYEYWGMEGYYSAPELVD